MKHPTSKYKTQDLKPLSHGTEGTDLRNNSYNVINSTVETHHSSQSIDKIKSELLSAPNWSAIQETLYLDSIPNVTKSIINGLQTHSHDCSSELKW